MITVGELREIFDGCWFKIITNTEDGEEVVIFDQEREKYNIPSFLEVLPINIAYIDDDDFGAIKIYIKNEHCEEK